MFDRGASAVEGWVKKETSVASATNCLRKQAGSTLWVLLWMAVKNNRLGYQGKEGKGGGRAATTRRVRLQIKGKRAGKKTVGLGYRSREKKAATTPQVRLQIQGKKSREKNTNHLSV